MTVIRTYFPPHPNPLPARGEGERIKIDFLIAYK